MTTRGFVADDDTLVAHGLNNLDDIPFVKQHAGWIVRLGEIDDGRAMFFDGGQHGADIEREIGFQRYPDKIHAGKLR